MKMLKRLYPLVCLGLLLMLAQTLWAQRVSIKIYGTDGIGNDSLVVGNDPAATNHIDAGLGEEEQPVEPLTFDIRSVSINHDGIKDTCLKGLKLNLHNQTRVTQTDEWKIQFESDDSGSTLMFSWQNGLDTVGGGGWQLIDGSPDLINGAHFPPVDMTQVTNFQYPLKSVYPVFQNVYIKHFDGLKMVTVDAESLANAHDTKNKVGTLQKQKAYHTDWCANFGGAPGAANGLHVEFDQPAVTFGGYSPFTVANTADGGKGKKWDFVGGSVSLNQVVQICGVSVGTKGNAAKKYWFFNGTSATVVGAKMGPATFTKNDLKLPIPNWWNLVYELYAQGCFPTTVNGKPWGLTIGSIDPLGKVGNTVYHPKWNDVLKTLYKSKLGTHKGGTGFGGLYCLNNFTKDGKPILKPQKTLPPDKHKNELLAEAITLKINLAMNKTNPNPPKVDNPNVYGDLLYIGGTHAGDATLNNLTVSQISTALDSFLTCRHNGAMGAMTGSNALAIVHDLNHAFSAAFDTSHWFPKMVIKGVKAVADVNFLYRPTAVIPPVVIGDYKEVAEVPLKYNLDQNYPNPFNPTTNISFTLPEDAFVTLKVYNILGQEVATLLNHEEMTAGSNDVEFDATSFSSGVYFYRLVVNDGKFQEVKKMMLMK